MSFLGISVLLVAGAAYYWFIQPKKVIGSYLPRFDTADTQRRMIKLEADQRHGLGFED